MGLGSGAENHTLLLNLGISIHFKSAISPRTSLFVTSPNKRSYFILCIACEQISRGFNLTVYE